MGTVTECGAPRSDDGESGRRAWVAAEAERCRGATEGLRWKWVLCSLAVEVLAVEEGEPASETGRRW